MALSSLSTSFAAFMRSGGVDHAEQEGRHRRAGFRAERQQRRFDAPLLRRREAGGERLPGRRRVEQPLTAILEPGALLDEAGIDQLLQHAREALLGDLQDVEEVGDRQAGIAVDEMQHAMMRASEIGLRQDRIRIGDEVAIGEEQKLDEIHHRIVGGGAQASRGERMIYVSHIDISCGLATLLTVGNRRKV